MPRGRIAAFVSGPLLACGLSPRPFLGGAGIGDLQRGRLRTQRRQGVVENSPCTRRKYFNYVLDPIGATLVCSKVGVWTATGPLIAVYNVTLRCATQGTSAQGSDGVAFLCTDLGGGLRWAHRTDTLE